MPKEKLILHPKRPKGEDGYKTFSIRIKDETVEKLEDICRKTGYSRNELISVFIDYAIENSEIAHA
ncbi:MAG: CopG family transcriptional regulator [Oscillospiraceae bacterium]|nr:CopG family transcriptional regulator [Oscillospiraceae bacterium]